jgi:AraC family transcriptional regulator of adaptative response / DNA-3-methyladenine glycosylase II
MWRDGRNPSWHDGAIPPAEICDRARVARDRRFDGRFFTGVVTTRIYCRPVCPVTPARSQNVRFFATAAAAEAAGFRPCLRCRPESAPGSPAWQGSGASVSRALALIDRGFLDEHRLPDLAAVLGIGARHVTRLFLRHCGASPGVLARSRRVQMAKRLLDETTLPMTQIAFASGFDSLRRFNSAFRETYGRSPSDLRRRGRAEMRGEAISLRLCFRPPYDWPLMLRLRSSEAIPGVECVAGGTYRRTLSIAGVSGWLAVRAVAGHAALDVSLSLESHGQLRAAIERVQTMFDLAADPSQIGRVLATCRRRGMVAAALPGIRLPGAWSGVETGTRALVERRVGADATTPVMGALVEGLGRPVSFRDQPGLSRLFPDAEQLGRVPLRLSGLSSRGEAEVRRFARAVAEGRIRFDASEPFARLARSLVEEGGLDRADAEWVAARTLGEPDADFAQRLALSDRERAWWRDATTQRALRPWRSYAALVLCLSRGRGAHERSVAP